MVPPQLEIIIILLFDLDSISCIRWMDAKYFSLCFPFIQSTNQNVTDEEITEKSFHFFNRHSQLHGVTHVGEVRCSE